MLLACRLWSRGADRIRGCDDGRYHSASCGAGRCVHQGGDVLDERACPTTLAARARFAAVASTVEAFVVEPPVTISMPPARTHARCSDRTPASPVRQVAQRIEPAVIDGCRRRGASATHARGPAPGSRAFPAPVRHPTGGAIVFGDDLDDVDSIEVARMPAASAGCHVTPKRS